MKSKVFSRYFGDGLKFNGVAGIPKDTMKVGIGLLHAPPPLPPSPPTHTHTEILNWISLELYLYIQHLYIQV